MSCEDGNGGIDDGDDVGDAGGHNDEDSEDNDEEMLSESDWCFLLE